MEGELHFYEVLYYLVDDTMELVEEIIDDSRVTGKRHKMIVRRQRLPKVSIYCNMLYGFVRIYTMVHQA